MRDALVLALCAVFFVTGMAIGYRAAPDTGRYAALGSYFRLDTVTGEVTYISDGGRQMLPPVPESAPLVSTPTLAVPRSAP